MNAREASLLAARTQREAADPRFSVVLSASAGSGKTKVLVDRFLRLCIEETPARCHPRAILAITFTKKAAVEIQERLQRAARSLALDAPEKVEVLLEDLLGREPSETERRSAGELFERLLEDTAGLNVGTIHSFCQNILGRFAAEAGLDPHFTVLEDTHDLVEEGLDRLAEEMSRRSDLSADAARLGHDPDSVRLALKKGQKQTMRLNRWLADRADPPLGEALLPPWHRVDVVPALLLDLRRALFPEIPSSHELTQMQLLPLVRDALQNFLDHGLPQVRQSMADSWCKPMETGIKKLEKAVQPWPEKLDGIDTEADALTALAAIKSIFLTTNDGARSFCRAGDGEGTEFNRQWVEQAMGVLTLCRMSDQLELYRTNAALLRLLARLLDILDELKRRDRAIDFQDLEDLACRLMADPGRALGLLHRLDDNLHHILLDEFQDTNFNQWDLMRHLVEEFLAGQPAGETQKSVFVVGDVKQSIYGFRAAEPELFSHVQEQFRRMEQKTLELPTNFRSLAAVVDGVGCVFNEQPLARHYTPQQREATRQKVFRTEASGRAVALPLFTPEDDDDRNADQLAATAAARLVRDLVEARTPVHEVVDGRVRIRDLLWEDIRILTRGRTHVGVYEKAFRALGVPMTPAGRGMLAASREVQDILALLRWLAYPADEVALVTVLRSPIFRWSEPRLQDALAARGVRRLDDEGRYRPPANLWDSLRRAKDADARILQSWRSRVGQEDAHALLRRIFQEGFLLERFETALGPQARQNLLRLFDLALSGAVAAMPTIRQLGDTIERAARRGTEEEADTPGGAPGGRTAFMTIHGAKGLEAPVILLADAACPPSERDSHLRLDPDDPSSPLLFKVRKVHREGYDLKYGSRWPDNPLGRAAAEARRRSAAEEANLLYVAMTRAREHLYLLGGGVSEERAAGSMLDQVRVAAEAGGCARLELDDPASVQRPPEALEPEVGETAARVHEADLPAWWEPPAMGERYRIETPSATDDSDASSWTKTGGQADRAAALERGNRVHLLLQLAAQGGRALPGDDAAHREAAAVFDNADYDWIFRPETAQGWGLCEAPVIVRRPSRVAGGREVRIIGSIDRLVVRPDRVDIIDYKTNRTRGQDARLTALCEHYRSQLAAYREAVQSLFPGRTIGTWLLFTDPDLPGAAGVLREVATS